MHAFIWLLIVRQQGKRNNGHIYLLALTIIFFRQMDSRVFNAADKWNIGKNVYHDLVFKHVISHGESTTVVSSDAHVTLGIKMFISTKNGSMDLVGYHSCDDPLAKPLSELMPFGLRMAVSTMSEGETAWITMNSLVAYGNQGFCFGDEVSEQIPPDSKLVYLVRLLRWRPVHLNVVLTDSVFRNRPRFEAMPAVEKELSEAEQAFGLGNSQRAYSKLHNAITLLKGMRIDAENEPEKEAERTLVLLESLKQLSTTALSLGRYGAAIAHGKHIVQIDPYDAVAHGQLARAYFSLGNMKGAWHSARRARMLDPRNHKYNSILSEIEQYLTLVEDIDSMEDIKDETEEFAEILHSNMVYKKKTILKEIESRISRAIEDGQTEFLIKGGFSASILDEIKERLEKKNAGILEVVQNTDSLKIKFLPESNESLGPSTE